MVIHSLKTRCLLALLIGFGAILVTHCSLSSDSHVEPTITQPQPGDSQGPMLFGIVFVSDRDGNEEVYRMSSDGQNVQRLTHTFADEQVVVVSRDGTGIAFDRGGGRVEREIYRLDVASGNVTQLTEGGGYDLAGAWSPSGDRIAFISDRDGGYYRLYLMNPDGSDQRHLPLATDSYRSVGGGVSWSPDGRYLIYATGEHRYDMQDVTNTLFIVDVSTLQITELTSEDEGDCLMPDWSWDGQWIVMVCTRGTRAGDYGEIYVVRPDGTDLRQVTNWPGGYQPDLAGTYVLWVGSPRWSPDGRQIVYDANPDLGQERNIYIMNADGTNNRCLTCGGGGGYDPSVYQSP